jgi:hypothetical protein
VNGVLTAVGTITPAGGQPLPFTTPVLDVSGTCEILSLVLGPIDLNLLGLRVQTNQIEIDITAVTGPANLLSNLLCAVAHLLDSNASTNALSRLLNQILGALG